jgi:gamma-glutamylputrescine oxidase
VRQFGAEEAPRLWEFALGGVNAIRQAILEDQIDCDMLVQDALFVAATGGGAQVISAEYAARNAFGYSSTVYSRESLPSILGSPAYFGALRFGNTFSIDGYRACARLQQGCLKQGANLRAQSGHADPRERSRDSTGFSASTGRHHLCRPVSTGSRPGPARGLSCRHSSPSPSASALRN